MGIKEECISIADFEKYYTSTVVFHEYLSLGAPLRPFVLAPISPFSSAVSCRRGPYCEMQGPFQLSVLLYQLS
jgi:hypothetical protein